MFASAQDTKNSLLIFLLMDEADLYLPHISYSDIQINIALASIIYFVNK